MKRAMAIVPTIAALTLGSTANSQAWREAFLAEAASQTTPALDEDGSSATVDSLSDLALLGDANAQTRLGLMYSDGEWDQRDYSRASFWFRLAAEKDHAVALDELGTIYFLGLGGLIEDYDESARLYQRAADQGYANAQRNLGRAYAWGRGVPEDDAAAAHWYRLAAEQGHIAAQMDLGMSYFHGLGVEQNYQAAAQWTRLAAEQGNVGAQDWLASFYARGEGVLQNFASAHMWYNIAAANGNIGASFSRDQLAERMTIEAIGEAQARARACMASGYQDCD